MRLVRDPTDAPKESSQRDSLTRTTKNQGQRPAPHFTSGCCRFQL